MRLINVDTLEMKEFTGKRPAYVILSHCWGDDEIKYKDYVKGRNTESAGYRKVRAFCKFVKSEFRIRYTARAAMEWMWIDTCCIDKRSSAELSEAINSMWKWYKRSACCVVYLADVPSWSTGEEEVWDCFRNSR